MSRFNPFADVSSSYGAPMGRISRNPGFEPEMKLSAQRSAWVDGDYDRGGAYWGRGRGNDHIWAVWESGHGDCGVVYVRARDRAHAITLTLQGWKTGTIEA